MKTFATRLLLIALVPLFTQCTSTSSRKKAPADAAPAAVTPVKNETAAAPVDDLDEYAVVEIADPFEKLNRGTFWLNDRAYKFVFRPISKGYEKILPKRVRNGIDNAFENAKFPIRFVNSALRGRFKNAGLQVGKFVVDTVGGVGGLVKRSKEIPVFAELPDEDTGKTFAAWGIGHGPYIVIPFFGPSSVRDGVGMIGDAYLNPVNYGAWRPGEFDHPWIAPSVNNLRLLPPQLELYDETVQDAIDPYIATRSAYVQYREEAVKK